MSRRLLVAVGAALAALSATASASAADRYLAVSGSNAGDCTSVAAPCSDFDYLESVATAGDTVHLAAGLYTTTNFPDRTVNTADLTLLGPTAGTPSPDATGPRAVITKNPGGAMLNVSASGVTLDGVYFAPGGSLDRSDYGVRSTAGLTFRNGLVNYVVDGISVTGGNATIEDTVVQSASGAGLLLGAGDHLVARNDVGAGQWGIDTTGFAKLTAERNHFWIGNQGAIRLGYGHGDAVIRGNNLGNVGGPWGLFNAGSGGTGASVDATDNWWGCNAGPGAGGCKDLSGGADVSTRLILTATANPDTVGSAGTSELSGTLSVNNVGTETAYGRWMMTWTPYTEIGFTASRGSLSASTATIGSDRRAAVTWTAPERGNRIDWTATYGAQTVSREIVMTTPDPVVVPTSTDFGEVVVPDGAKIEVIRLENHGGGGLEDIEVTLEGPGADRFSLFEDRCTTFEVPSDEYCTVAVRFVPGTVGDYEAELRFATDAGTLSAELTGEGVLAPVASVSPSSLAFGSQVPGVASPAQTVTVTNDGPSTLLIEELRRVGTGKSQFSIVADTCTDVALAVDETCAFEVQFAPAQTGSWSPRIEVFSNGAKKVVNLSGTGVHPVTATPDRLDFGPVAVDDYLVETVTVRNNTPDPVTYGGQRIRGTGSSLYTVGNVTCGATIAPGTTCQLEVAFQPRSTGTWAPVLTVQTSGGAVAVPLPGTGVERFTVTPASHDFGSVPRRTTSFPQTFTVTNNTDDDRVVSAVRKDGTGSSLFPLDAAGCVGATLPAGESCTFTVRFAPLAAGSWSPVVLVTIGGRTLRVPVSGTGV